MRLQLHQRSALTRACRSLGMAALIAVTTASTTHAGHGDPGSLLLCPQFDQRPGRMSILSVTNTSSTESVNVEFVYIGRQGPASDCFEFNRIDSMTPGDTFSAVVSAHNPTHDEGFVYIVAQSATGFQQPISFNHLLGTMTIIDGINQNSYEMEALSYLGLTGAGMDTDLDADGRRDLDGVEYSQVADTILIPRFMGQSTTLSSEIILVNLTLTRHATATVDFLVYNDNEEIFSVEYSFNCWDRAPLMDVSGLFSNDFLSLFTNHAPGEIVGATDQEAGWMRVWGSHAATKLTTVTDPAILAVLVESTVNTGTTASLPFELGLRSSGSLIQNGLTDLTNKSN